MSRYIDKDSLIKRLKNRNYVGNCIFCDYYETCINRKGSHKNCWKEITVNEINGYEIFPNNRDSNVVEVIRCKDCKYSRKLCNAEKEMYGENYVGCTNLSTGYNTVVISEDDYCSYAERKDEQ